MKPSHTKSTREARKFRFIFLDEYSFHICMGVGGAKSKSGHCCIVIKRLSLQIFIHICYILSALNFSKEAEEEERLEPDAVISQDLYQCRAGLLSSW